MRIRRKYWFVPALAILGIILALMHFYSRPAVHEEVLLIDPNEPAPPLPTPAPKEVAPPATEEVPSELPQDTKPAPAGTTPQGKAPLSPEQVAQIRSEIKIPLASALV